jgi:hypothetical protein
MIRHLASTITMVLLSASTSLASHCNLDDNPTVIKSTVALENGANEYMFSNGGACRSLYQLLQKSHELNPAGMPLSEWHDFLESYQQGQPSHRLAASQSVHKSESLYFLSVDSYLSHLRDWETLQTTEELTAELNGVFDAADARHRERKARHLASNRKSKRAKVTVKSVPTAKAADDILKLDARATQVGAQIVKLVIPKAPARNAQGKGRTNGKVSRKELEAQLKQAKAVYQAALAKKEETQLRVQQTKLERQKREESLKTYERDFQKALELEKQTRTKIGVAERLEKEARLRMKELKTEVISLEDSKSRLYEETEKTEQALDKLLVEMRLLVDKKVTSLMGGISSLDEPEQLYMQQAVLLPVKLIGEIFIESFAEAFSNGSVLTKQEASNSNFRETDLLTSSGEK